MTITSSVICHSIFQLHYVVLALLQHYSHSRFCSPEPARANKAQFAPLYFKLNVFYIMDEYVHYRRTPSHSSLFAYNRNLNGALFLCMGKIVATSPFVFDVEHFNLMRSIYFMFFSIHVFAFNLTARLARYDYSHSAVIYLSLWSCFSPTRSSI